MILWINKNKKELLLLIAILLLAAFFRFYRLDEYMQFLGDQGRDAIIVKTILTGQNFPAIGPPSSVGTIYLGPLYYYLMAFSMLVFWLNPAAAAGMVALIGVTTVFLIYYLGREWFGKKAGLVSGFLFAISPVLINYSRFSWNPNLVPFFTLLAFLGLYKAHKSRNYKWFILTGFSLAAVLQMHYLALILLPIFGLLWLNELRIYFRKESDGKSFIIGTFFSVTLFFMMMVPLAVFDYLHGFLNFHGLVNLFFGQNSGVSLNLAGSFSRLPDVFINSFIGRYLAGNNTALAIAIGLLIFIPIIRRWYLFYKKRLMSWVILTLTIWLGLGFFGLMFYKGEIYDHYLLFLSPVPFILLGAIAEFDLDLKGFRYFKTAVFWLLLAVIIFLNITVNPLLSPPNGQLQKSQQISKFIISESAVEPYNFALLSENNYDAAYQFYLDQYGKKPKNLPDLSYEKTDQLFVVCEDQICKPVGHPKQEIAAFGWTKIEWEKELEGVKVFKLIPNPDQPVR